MTFNQRWKTCQSQVCITFITVCLKTDRHQCRSHWKCFGQDLSRRLESLLYSACVCVCVFLTFLYFLSVKEQTTKHYSWCKKARVFYFYLLLCLHRFDPWRSSETAVFSVTELRDKTKRQHWNRQTNNSFSAAADFFFPFFNILGFIKYILTLQCYHRMKCV